MKKIRRFTLVAVMACISSFLFSNNSAAQQITPEKTEEVQLSRSDNKLKGRVSVAHLFGEARELVYDLSWEGEKGSELIWTLENVYMAGLGFSFQPVERMTFNLDGWINVSKGSGEMDDYDWFIRDEEWSDWSHSAQVELDRGFIFDINAEIPLIKPKSFTLNAIVGYRIDNWKWVDYGDGRFVYTINSFRDTSGYFPGDTLGITYEQTYKTPYIGIAIKGNLSALELETRLTGSPFVRLEAKDHHHSRNDVFHDHFKNGEMIVFDVKGAYRFADHYGMQLGYTFQKYYRMHGDTTAYYSNGTTESYPNGAGAELRYHKFSVNFIYMF